MTLTGAIRSLCLALLLYLIYIGVVYAQISVDIEKRGRDKIAIDLADFETDAGVAAATFTKTLQNDLVRSGWFAVVGRGQGDLRLLGSCSLRGAAMQAECQVFAISDRRRYLGKAYNGKADEARQLAHRVADDIVEAVKGVPGIASTRIAMIGTASGKKEVYICDADGGNLLQLTRDQTVSIAPVWDAKGGAIYYTSYIKRFPNILKIDMTSGKRSRVAHFPGLNTSATVSPDGRTLALILSKDGNPELYTMDISSRRLTRITHTLRGNEAGPTWSPDGQRIAYVADTSGRPQLYVVASSGGSAQRLRLRGSENVAPDWGPNGYLAYSSRIGGTYQVFIFDPDGGGTPVQISSGQADFEDPSWACDGRHIICSVTKAYRSQIYILDIKNDPPVVLHLYKGDWYSPDWSPQ